MALTPERCAVCKAKLRNGRVEGCDLPRELNQKIGELSDLEKRAKSEKKKGFWAVVVGLILGNRDLQVEVLRAEIKQIENDLEDCWGLR